MSPSETFGESEVQGESVDDVNGSLMRIKSEAVSQLGVCGDVLWGLVRPWDEGGGFRAVNTG